MSGKNPPRDRQKRSHADMVLMDDIEFEEDDDVYASDDSFDDEDYVMSGEENIGNHVNAASLSESDDEDGSDVSMVSDVNEVNAVECEPDCSSWNLPPQGFKAMFQLPDPNQNIITDPGIKSTSSPLQIFLKVFPLSLFMYMANCTNQRLEKLGKAVRRTDCWEIMIVVGCTLIIGYNKLPSLNDYWSNEKSKGNRAIREVISRDRFKLLVSKLYFGEVDRPENASKTHYVDQLVACLKSTFQKMRTDSPFQSLDESMAKFKGRSSLKQYMPMKPVKRGIKLWLRCDSDSGYTYDFNVYCGKETGPSEGTLGERVVRKLASSIVETGVCLVFDRFFTSVRLIATLGFPCLGTANQTRKNMPSDFESLSQGESQFLCNGSGVLAVKWKDTKDVVVLSNCHMPKETTITKKLKNGERVTQNCPEQIAFYRKKMGGVDRADQMASIYDVDRKSNRWWKKVFYHLLHISVVNAWVLNEDVRREKTSLITFLSALAERLVAHGKSRTAIQTGGGTGGRKRPPRVSAGGVIGDHLPKVGDTRRRCFSCSRQSKERRTNVMCTGCDKPICMECFYDFHKSGL